MSVDAHAPRVVERQAARRASRQAPRRSSRLAGSIALSAVLHVAVIAAMIVRVGKAPPPSAPVYRVDLVAAPPGERAIGTVAPEPPPPAAEAPAPAPEPTPAPPPRPETRPKEMAPPPSAKKPVVKPPPPVATPVPPTPAKPSATKPPVKPTAKPTATPPAKAAAKTPPTAASAPGPRAGGGPVGGRGADVANVHIQGLEFQDPVYLANIVRQIALRFTPANRATLLQADVAFLIHRDGSVSDVRVAKGSGNYAFDLEARGAIEETGQAKAFGPLPAGFSADVLPVTFSFDPRVIR